MYRLTRFEEKLKYIGYIECTELCKFKGKLCTSDVQIVWIYGKNLNTLDTMNLTLAHATTSLCMQVEFWILYKASFYKNLNKGDLSLLGIVSTSSL